MLDTGWMFDVGRWMFSPFSAQKQDSNGEHPTFNVQRPTSNDPKTNAGLRV
jgi:hypothetical protein